VATPEAELVSEYLKAIAAGYGVDYEPKEKNVPSLLEGKVPRVSFPPSAPPPNEFPQEDDDLKKQPETKESVPDFDELAKRLEALRQKK
jgi:hypothetical protein